MKREKVKVSAILEQIQLKSRVSCFASSTGIAVGIFKKTIVVFVSLAMLALMLAMPAMAASTGNWQDSGNVATGFQAGSGSATSPYQIETAGQLAYLAKQVNAGTTYLGDYFILNNDIDLTGNSWTPIGDTDDDNFYGDFDGAGHKISGLTIGTQAAPDNTIEYSGLFGSAADDTIKNVSVIESIYSSYSTEDESAYIGGIVGLSYESNITNCSSTGNLSCSGDSSTIGGIAGMCYGTEFEGYISTVTSVVSNETYSLTNSNSTCTILGGSDATVGGIVGDDFSENIQNCYSTGSISGGDGSSIGGIVTIMDAGTIQNCYTTGNVTGGDNSYLGGIVFSNGGNVINCYATGTVSGGDSIMSGGLVCENTGEILNSYATGAVKGSVSGGDSAELGGLVGDNEGTISNCYSSGSVSGGDSAELGGLVGGNGSAISNCYSTGIVTSGSNSIIGGFVGDEDEDYGTPTINNGYWNKAAATIGVGSGTDTSTPMALSDMQNTAASPTFAATLNFNIKSLSLSGCYSWEYVSNTNNACPSLHVSVVTKITVTAPTKVLYGKGQTLNLTGSTITATNSDGTTSKVPVTLAMVSGFSSSTGGTKTVKVSYSGLTASFNISVDVTAPTIKANAANNSKVHGKVTVTVSDANPLSKTIQLSGKTISWGSGAYTTKGKYVVTATDKVGNKSTYTFTIY